MEMSLEVRNVAGCRDVVDGDELSRTGRRRIDGLHFPGRPSPSQRNFGAGPSEIPASDRNANERGRCGGIPFVDEVRVDEERALLDERTSAKREFWFHPPPWWK
jgi:hypothetical protein